MRPGRPFRRPTPMILAAAMAACGASGCQLAGVIAANEARYGSSEKPALYTGLAGHSYAVVIQADREILAENPNLMEYLLAQVNARLAENAGASGHVPTEQLLLYLMNNTRWGAMSNAELAAALGNVERLVVLDLSDYRLTEENNPYVWAGLAQGRLSVFEADGAGGGEVAFEREIRVTYPDISGVTPDDQPRATVTSLLSRRLIDRTVWPFYAHEEPNAITY